MQQDYPFQPTGGAASTVNATVTTSSAQISLGNAVGADGGSMLLTNIGTQTVFIAYGTVTASITTSMPLLPNTATVISAPAGITSLSVIASSVGSVLYITTGCGS
jgi:hypothetical protein